MPIDEQTQTAVLSALIVEKANVGRYMFGDNIVDKCLAFMAFFEPSE